jgi:hypothetical protein
LAWTRPNPAQPFAHFSALRYSESAFYQFWQDATNQTFTAKCSAAQAASVACADSHRVDAVSSRLVSLAAANLFLAADLRQIAAFVQAASPRTVALFDAVTGEAVGSPLTFAEGEKVVSVALSAEWLIVGLEEGGSGKVAAFELAAVIGAKGEAQAKVWKSLGFKISRLTVCPLHPSLLFVQSDAKLSVFEFSSAGISLVTEIDSLASRAESWSFSVSKDYLILAGGKQRVEEYSLSELYSSRKVVFLKTVSLFSYELVTPVQIVASPAGNLTYIVVKDQELRVL